MQALRLVLHASSGIISNWVNKAQLHTPTEEGLTLTEEQIIDEEKTEEEEEEEEEEEKMEKYREAGIVAHEALVKAVSMVELGVKLVDICEAAENYILQQGLGISFPLNISLDNHAAHYTSPPDDENVIGEKSIVKLDLGAHKDGYVSDTAFTVTLDENLASLVEASNQALKVAIDTIKPGVMTNEIGALIEETIKRYGYRPIRDLSGHLVDKYELHGPKIIPNIAMPHGKEFEEGEVYGFETFATTGSGRVHEDRSKCYIFSLLPIRVSVRSKAARRGLAYVAREFKQLPFTERALRREFKPADAKFTLRELQMRGALHRYHVLSEVKEAMVAQSEHTIILTADGVEITTLPSGSSLWDFFE